MKTIFSLIFLIAAALSLSAQTTIVTSDSAWDNTGDVLHGIANEFSDIVGQVLRDEFPSKVDYIELNIQTNTLNQIVLTYKAVLEECSESEAQTHFDHRGSLSCGTSLDFVKSDASNRCKGQVQKAYQGFQDTYGNCSTYFAYSNVRVINKYWAIYEMFFMSNDNESVAY